APARLRASRPAGPADHPGLPTGSPLPPRSQARHLAPVPRPPARHVTSGFIIQPLPYGRCFMYDYECRIVGGGTPGPAHRTRTTEGNAHTMKDTLDTLTQAYRGWDTAALLAEYPRQAEREQAAEAAEWSDAAEP